MKKLLRPFIVAVLSICMALSLSACDPFRVVKYYAQVENYIAVEGTIDHLIIDYLLDDDGCEGVYIGFSDVEGQSGSVDYLEGYSFVIEGENLRIVKEKGIDQKIKMGDRIKFVTAPRCFGDGYFLPIVSITTADGETLLESEEGIPNLLKWLMEEAWL